MAYVECYIAAVPTENEEAYKKKCANMGQVFKENGALRTVDAWGSMVPDGEMTSFPLAVKAKDGETVCLGWVEWSSREARDKGMEAAMSDKRMTMDDMPFDGKRLIFAGFDIFSDMK